MASTSITVVEYVPHHSVVKGSSSAIAAGIKKKDVAYHMQHSGSTLASSSKCQGVELCHCCWHQQRKSCGYLWCSGSTLASSSIMVWVLPLKLAPKIIFVDENGQHSGCLISPLSRVRIPPLPLAWGEKMVETTSMVGRVDWGKLILFSLLSDLQKRQLGQNLLSLSFSISLSLSLSLSQSLSPFSFSISLSISLPFLWRAKKAMAAEWGP